MEHNKYAVGVFSVLNVLTTILSLIIINLMGGLLGFGSTSDGAVRNFTLLVIAILLIEALKWLAFYFVVFKEYNGWFYYFALYALLFVFIAIQIPLFWIIPALYLGVMVWLSD